MPGLRQTDGYEAGPLRGVQVLQRLSEMQGPCEGLSGPAPSRRPQIAPTGRRAAPRPAAGSDKEVPVELSPLDPAYERPESELPVLSFPHSEELEFRMGAEQRRRVRIRNEAVFGGF